MARRTGREPPWTSSHALRPRRRHAARHRPWSRRHARRARRRPAAAPRATPARDPRPDRARGHELAAAQVPDPDGTAFTVPAAVTPGATFQGGQIQATGGCNTARARTRSTGRRSASARSRARRWPARGRSCRRDRVPRRARGGRHRDRQRVHAPAPPGRRVHLAGVRARQLARNGCRGRVPDAYHRSQGGATNGRHAGVAPPGRQAARPAREVDHGPGRSATHPADRRVRPDPVPARPGGPGPRRGRRIPGDATAVAVPVGTSGDVPAELGLSRAALVAAGFPGAVGQAMPIPGDARAGARRRGRRRSRRPGCGRRLRDAAAAFARADVPPRADRRRAAGSLGVEPAAAAQAVVEGVLLARYRYRGVPRPARRGAPRGTDARRRRRRAPTPCARAPRAAGRPPRPTHLARDLANTPADAPDRDPVRRDRRRRSARQPASRSRSSTTPPLVEMGCGGLLGRQRRQRARRRGCIKLTYTPGRATRPATSRSSARGSCTTPAASASSRRTRCTPDEARHVRRRRRSSPRC